MDGLNRDDDGDVLCEVYTIQNAVFIARSEGAEIRSTRICEYVVLYR